MILEAGDMRLELLRTRGEVLEMVATYGPGVPAPPRHFHPRQEERFTIQSGAIWFEVDGRERVLQKGESLTVPPGAVHRARNASDREPSVMHWETRPALRSAQLFEALYAMAREGRSVLTMASIMREFRDEFRLASPPPLVQSCVFGLLAPLARALGKGAAFTR
jgi:quercetin dioxygenase-like cupin family protein